MAGQHAVSPNGERGLAESVVMGSALVGFAATCALFVTSPSNGLVSPFGMVISILAGAYLLFVVYSYLE